jgi:putative methionine-R-sulfoxide reductase with GAF domain
MVLPVSIWGTDSSGKAFHQLAYTLDISTGGAKLAGVMVELKRDEIIAVRYKQSKSRFRVVWSANHEVGIQYIEGEHFIWIELPEEEFIDREPVRVAEPRPAAAGTPPASADSSPAGSEAAPPAPAQQEAGSAAGSGPGIESSRTEGLAATLETCLASLRSLDGLVNSAGMVAQVAQEFHAAAGHLRNTAWAVQQWIELPAESTDHSTMIASVNSERLRFAAQLCRELAQDQQYLAAGVSPENREALVAAVQLLAQKLGVGLQPQSPRAEPTAKSAKRDPVALLAGLNQEIRSTALSAEETLDLMAERARSFTDADGAAIALRDQEHMVCCASSGMAPLAGIRFSVAGGLAGEAIATRQIFIWQDAEKDERVDASLCRSLDLRSSAIAPIVAGDSVMGVLQVFSARTNVFDEAAVSLLQHLAEFVASLEPALRVESDAR